MEPKITHKPAFIVAGKKYHGNNANNEVFHLWRESGVWMGKIAHVTNPNVAYGVMGNYDEQSQEFDYLAGVEVNNGDDQPEGLTSWAVPEQTYAVFTCTLPAIMEAYQHILQTWLPQSGYQHAGGPEFELYDEKFSPENPASLMYIYIPIVQCVGA